MLLVQYLSSTVIYVTIGLIDGTMDNRDVLSKISKDGPTSKNAEAKQTKVFVLSPDILKGLLNQNKISKINLPLPSKTEIVNVTKSNNSAENSEQIYAKSSIGLNNETNKSKGDTTKQTSPKIEDSEKFKIFTSHSTKEKKQKIITTDTNNSSELVNNDKTGDTNCIKTSEQSLISPLSKEISKIKHISDIKNIRQCSSKKVVVTSKNNQVCKQIEQISRNADESCKKLIFGELSYSSKIKSTKIPFSNTTTSTSNSTTEELNQIKIDKTKLDSQYCKTKEINEKDKDKYQEAQNDLLQTTLSDYLKTDAKHDLGEDIQVFDEIIIVENISLADAQIKDKTSITGRPATDRNISTNKVNKLRIYDEADYSDYDENDKLSNDNVNFVSCQKFDRSKSEQNFNDKKSNDNFQIILNKEQNKSVNVYVNKRKTKNEIRSNEKDDSSNILNLNRHNENVPDVNNCVSNAEEALKIKYSTNEEDISKNQFVKVVDEKLIKFTATNDKTDVKVNQHQNQLKKDGEDIKSVNVQKPRRGRPRKSATIVKEVSDSRIIENVNTSITEDNIETTKNEERSNCSKISNVSTNYTKDITIDEAFNKSVIEADSLAVTLTESKANEKLINCSNTNDKTNEKVNNNRHQDPLKKDEENIKSVNVQKRRGRPRKSATIVKESFTSSIIENVNDISNTEGNAETSKDKDKSNKIFNVSINNSDELCNDEVLQKALAETELLLNALVDSKVNNSDNSIEIPTRSAFLTERLEETYNDIDKSSENNYEKDKELKTENTFTKIDVPKSTNKKQTNTDEENSKSVNVQKGRRGRPRKTITAVNKTSDTSINENINSISNIINEAECTKTECINNSLRVSSVLTNKENNLTEYELLDKSVVGVESSSNAIPENEESIISTPVRKRGRPPKSMQKIVHNTEDLCTNTTRSNAETEISKNEEVQSSSNLGRSTRNKSSSIIDDTFNDEDLSDNDNMDNDKRIKRKVHKKYEERKRGRPKGSGNKTVKYDEEYTPHHSQLPKFPSRGKKRHEHETNSTKKMVTCGKCDKEMPKNLWSYHNLKSHNDLGWLKDAEKPDYDNDERLVKKILFIAIKKRKGILTCETCDTVKRSVLGFLSHVTFCGKDETEVKALMVTCPVCLAVTKPSSMEYHDRLHKMQAEAKLKIDESQADMESGMKLKRKAAEKAITKITEFSALVKDDKDEKDLPPDKRLKLMAQSVKHFIEKPRNVKRIPNRTLSIWNQTISEGKTVFCNQAGCSFHTNCFEEIKNHASTCNFTPETNYICKRCRDKFATESEIVDHIVQKHSLDDNDENVELSDAESDSSIACSSDGCDENRTSTKQVIPKEKTDASNQTYKFLCEDSDSSRNFNKSYSLAFKWTLEFEQKNYNLDLFREFLPNAFELLNEEELKEYLPELKESMLAKSVKDLSKDSMETEWKKWKIFESHCVHDNPTFFVGGPIWAIAWLPIPTALALTKDVEQFIALSTHSEMDIDYTVGQSYSGKNIIQIWNVGCLNHMKLSDNIPKLEYAIIHDGGTVWCLEWCPTGCYQNEKMSDFIQNIDTKRMGMLAAACSDGCVRVYSLIFPEDLPSRGQVSEYSENRFPVYKTDPVLMLVVNVLLYDKNEQPWQVTKLCWSKEKDNNVIVGGFSNGFIALWDITTKSPLLRHKRGNTVYLNPYRHFHAHHHAVTMVHLIPQDDKRFLATASLDRYYKFWDLEDVSNEKHSFKKSFVTNGAWMNNWCCAIISYDDGLGMNHNFTYCLPLREHTYKYYNILPANSTCYGLSTSDYGNSIAIGTLAGEVLAIFPHQMLYLRNMERVIPRKRHISIISTINIEDFQAKSKDKEVNDNTNQENETEIPEYTFMPSSYKESKDRFGIIFHDKMRQFSNIPPLGKKTLTSEMMQSVPIEQYPFTSVNRVAWNPNSWSFLWLATGYQNGFVRLISFKSVASTAEWNKLLSSHIHGLKLNTTTNEAIS